ncbi:MAG: DAK2 domain-containing protein [Clostridia bacterium]|nr:DAK2 domain-containing protein [Clostridia bacterium]
MFISGANNLYNNRFSVDELNVFPVPDGDTGTNMSMTATAMAKALSEVQTESVSKTADIMSFATLRGARGNSGVILSQFFRGMSKSLKGKMSCGAKDIAAALCAGSDTAYNAVMNPTEGTILTVAREAANAAKKTDGDLIAIFEAAVKKGGETLKKTPEMLPALKKAGVVDAGGQGWLFVLEGALYFLKTGEVVTKNESEQPEETEQSTSAQQKIDTENIKFMYCTEFIVEKKDSSVNVLSFKKAIEKIGDSMLVIDDDDIIKVHIHTNNPGYVLECAVKLGAMINIKIDNMKHQHQSLITQEEKSEKTEAVAEEKPHKEYGFVSICAGSGISGIFKDLGVDEVIEGGQTMNPSTDDILNAVNNINADNIFVFPNNKNIILAANQAKEISKKNVIVIPTRSIPECIAAMLKFSEGKDAAANETAMNKAVSKVVTGQITYAVRDTEVDDKKIHKDDILGLAGSKIKTVGTNPDEVLMELVDELCDEDSEFITLYYGEDVKQEDAERAAELIEEKYDEVEVSVKYGGQPLYYYIISVE